MKISSTILTSLLTNISVLGVDSDGDGLSDTFERGEDRYAIVPGERTWKQAKTHAESLGGHLATITSPQEHQRVVEQIGQQLPDKLWLGATDENSEGTWLWVTGETWQWSNWYRQSEPNNMWGTQHYLHTKGGSGGWDDQWNDVPEEKTQDQNVGYLIEYPGAITDPHDADSDNDGYTDGEEHASGTDPNDSGSRPVDVSKLPQFTPGESPETKCRQVIKQLEQTIETLVLSGQEQLDRANALARENAALTEQLSNVQSQLTEQTEQVVTSNESLTVAIQAAETPFITGCVYDPERGWIYTDVKHYPLVYVEADSSWHYYELGSSEPRWFYSYKTDRWEAWDPEPVAQQ